MNEIQLFTDGEFNMRTAVVDGEPLFCLVDVCKVLDIQNPSKVAQRLDDDERTKLELGRQGETNFITESGLYAVILRSDKPNAKSFRRWVTSEVLPSIRKTGATISRLQRWSRFSYLLRAIQSLQREWTGLRTR